MSLPSLSPLADQALAFVLTYLIHSSVLIVAVYALVRFAKPRSNPLREALWSAALFGGIVTTCFQFATGPAPRVPTIQLRAAADPVATTPSSALSQECEVVNDGRPNAPSAEFPARSNDPDDTSLRRFQGFGGPIQAKSKDGKARASVVADPKPAELLVVHGKVPGEESSFPSAITAFILRLRAAVPSVRVIASPVLGLAMIGGALWLLCLVVRSRRALRERRLVPSGELFDRLETLKARFGISFHVSLTTSHRIASPVAFGFFDREICVPVRALDELDPSQQEAMLAHELAHLVRRDPLRLVLARTLESVMFFQPLNRLARRQLFEVIEQRCDAFAVERLGAGLALAGCLAEVASWIHDAPQRSLAPAMAEFGSALGRRIEGLLDEDRTLQRERSQRNVAPLVFLVLPLVAISTPAVAVPPRRVALAHPSVGLMTPSPKETSVGTLALANDEAGAELSEVIASLDAEITALSSELHAVRADLGESGAATYEASLDALESRLERLEGQRTKLAAYWRARTSRSATTTENESDRSNSRRKP